MTIHNREEHFWSKVDKKEDHECWEWKGAKDKCGYGNIGVEYKTILTHRLAYEFFYNRKIPIGLCVLHICDNPSCCNPHHLVIGTQGNNARDRQYKGRGGDFKIAISKAKFSAKDIMAIRNFKTLQITKAAVAKKFNTSGNSIANIWKANKYPCKEGYYV